MRFPLEYLRRSVRAAVPGRQARPGRESPRPTGCPAAGKIRSSQALKARGCAAIHVASGGVSPQQAIKLGPGYQARSFAQRVKA